ncbi:methionyl-tRNA formyltransferase [Spongorhabdus nitratireducens]
MLEDYLYQIYYCRPLPSYEPRPTMPQPDSTQPLRIVFAGTPDFAAAHLQTLLDSRHEVIAVYTQPDRPAGRGRQLAQSPVKQLAVKHDIPVLQPKSLKGEPEQQELAALQADLMVVVAYGLILPQVVLDTPRYGCINVHASILPRWRGAAPIQRAIAAGDAESGVTIMQMDAGLDTGDMLIKNICPIHDTDTGSDLHDRLIETGKPALEQALAQIAAGTLQPESQNNELCTYAHKLTKEEGMLDWSRPALELKRQVQALNPWPVAWTEIDGERVRVWTVDLGSSTATAEPGTILSADKSGIEVATAEGSLLLTQLQPSGKRAMNAADLLNSRREQFESGKRFG